MHGAQASSHRHVCLLPPSLSLPRSFHYNTTLHRNHALHQPFHHLLESTSSLRPRLTHSCSGYIDPLPPPTDTVATTCFLHQISVASTSLKTHIQIQSFAFCPLKYPCIIVQTLTVYFPSLHLFLPSASLQYTPLFPFHLSPFQNSHLSSSRSLSVGLLGYLNSFLGNHLFPLHQHNRRFMSIRNCYYIQITSPPYHFHHTTLPIFSLYCIWSIAFGISDTSFEKSR